MAAPDGMPVPVAVSAANPRWYRLNYVGVTGTLIANRNRAYVQRVWGRTPAPRGQQLDEFPYARTLEGGPAGPALGMYVPWLENSVQGGLFGAFTRYSLRGVPSPFLVVPVPL